MVDDTALSAGHPDMDYAEHEKTYKLFLWLLKNGAIGVIIILVILAVLFCFSSDNFGICRTLKRHISGVP